MCEILLCVKNKGNSGIKTWDERAPKAGDVVCVMPDGHAWGSLELGGHAWGDIQEHCDERPDSKLKRGERYYICAETGNAKPIHKHANGNHDFFRVVKLPNCTVSQLEMMLAEEPQVDPRRPSPYLQYRLNYFDRAKFKAAHIHFASHWDDDTRSQPTITFNVTWAQIKDLISQRKPVPF